MGRISSWRITPGSMEYPIVIAHRGASGLAPENTLAAFHKALEVGADAIELDVRLTEDGRVAVIHDRRLDRTTTGNGPVGTCTLTELKSLDAGSWYGPEYKGERVPTLEEVFEALPGDFPIYVEMKARGPGARPLAVRVAEIVRRYERWDSTMAASFNPVATIIIRAIEPRIIRGYIWARHHPLPLSARWLSPLVKPHWLAPDRNTFAPEMLTRFHAQGMSIAPRDLDVGTDPSTTLRADMKRLGEMRLDAVVTDHPEVLAFST